MPTVTQISPPYRSKILLFDCTRAPCVYSKPKSISPERRQRCCEAIKAKKILIELLSTLDMEQGGEVAEQLQQLYIFFIEHIGDATR